jgi:hypothetical protein
MVLATRNAFRITRLIETEELLLRFQVFIETQRADVEIHSVIANQHEGNVD